MRTAPRLQDNEPPGQRPMARALASGTRLHDFEITGLIGESALSVIYLAWDGALQRKVAIKEYMPLALAARTAGGPGLVLHANRHAEGFRAGLYGFVSEARLLARFDHPSLVKVYRYWEENGTAYQAMPYYEGPTLQAALAELGHVPSEAELRSWLRPLLDAVTRLHEGGSQHLNLGPDEIVLTAAGPVLLGLGAAGSAIATAQEAPAAALKPGYAALEQYHPALSPSGPYTDLYGLGAILYFAIAGVPPPAADERQAADWLKPLSLVAAGLYSPAFLGAIDAALALAPLDRPANIAAFRTLMGAIDTLPVAVPLAPRRDLMQEPFIGKSAGPREVTVPDHPLLLGVTTPAVRPAEEARQKPLLRLPPSEGPLAPGAAREATRPAAISVEPETAPQARPRRSPYGMIAVVCVVIGLGALAVQYASRQVDRGGAVPATAARPAKLPASGSPALALPGSRPPANPAAPVEAPAAAPVLPGLMPRTAVLPPAASSPPTQAGPVVAAPTPAASATEQQRLARCTEILQKASLEKITPAETAFFKKECK